MTCKTTSCRFLIYFYFKVIIATPPRMKISYTTSTVYPRNLVHFYRASITNKDTRLIGHTVLTSNFKGLKRYETYFNLFYNIFCAKQCILMPYIPEWKKGYTSDCFRDWLTEWVSEHCFAPERNPRHRKFRFYRINKLRESSSNTLSYMSWPLNNKDKEYPLV